MHFSLERFCQCHQQADFLLHTPGWFVIQANILSCLLPAQGQRFVQTCVQLLIDRQDLFLTATAIRIQYTGSAYTVATPPLQIVLAPAIFGQGGVWDLSFSGQSFSSRSLPSSNDALEESHIDSVQVQ